MSESIKAREPDDLSRFAKFDRDDEGIRLPSPNLAGKLSPAQLSVGGRNAFMACQKVLRLTYFTSS